MYFISTKNFNNKKLIPRIPINYFTKNNYENNSIKRISFSKSILGALAGLSSNLTNKTLYVHVPNPKPNKEDIITNSEIIKNKYVPDAKITKEFWVMKLVILKSIMKIKVIKAKNGMKFYYGTGKNRKSAILYNWKYIILEKL